MDFAQAIVLALVGLILAPGLQFYFDVTPKIVVLLAGTALLLIWHARRPAAARDRSDDWGVQRVFAIVVLWNAISLLASATLSQNPALSWFGTNWRRFGALEQCAVLLFAWLMARHNAGQPEKIRTVLRGAAIAGVVTSAYGIAQYFGWDPILPKAAYHVGEGVWTIVRPPGTLGYASYFATWLVVTAFLGPALAALETGTVWRGVAWASTALSLGALFLNGTRAALVGLVAGGVVWIWGRGFRRGRRLAAGVALAALAAAVFYLSPAGAQLRSRTRWFAEDPWGGGRAALWRDTLSMASHRLLLGYGPEVFTAAFPQYESARLARQYPDFSYESPHNMLLDALVAQGVPGLLGVCALCWIGFRAARRTKHPAGLLLAGALAAGAISQQFTVMTAPTALLIFAVAGMAVACEDDRSLTVAAPIGSREGEGANRENEEGSREGEGANRENEEGSREGEGANRENEEGSREGEGANRENEEGSREGEGANREDEEGSREGEGANREDEEGSREGEGANREDEEGSREGEGANRENEEGSREGEGANREDEEGSREGEGANRENEEGSREGEGANREDEEGSREGEGANRENEEGSREGEGANRENEEGSREGEGANREDEEGSREGEGANRENEEGSREGEGANRENEEGSREGEGANRENEARSRDRKGAVIPRLIAAVACEDNRSLTVAPPKGAVVPRLIAAVAAAIFLVVAARMAMADFALAATQRDLQVGRVQEAAASYAQYDRWRLPGTSADLWYSRASVTAAQAKDLDIGSRLTALGQYGFAALRATATDESPFDAWYNASQYYAVRNDAAGTERALLAAIAARPQWFKPHWALAQVLRLENRLAEADREAALAADLDGGAHAEVAATAQQIHREAANATDHLQK